MKKLEKLIEKGDLRVLIQSDEIYYLIQSQSDFDLLFVLMFHHEKNVTTRAAEVIEELTKESPELLFNHKEQLLALLLDHPVAEQKWHLAKLVTRVSLDQDDLRRVWAKLKYWATNPNEQKLVRANSIQALYDLMQKNDDALLLPDFKNIVRNVEQEHIPSLSGKIRKLRKKAKMSIR